MKDVNYITQLSKQDLAEIKAATDPVAGFCIRIEKSNGKLKIGLDESAFALALNGFYRNGGMTATAANCTSISFNPPS